MEALKLKGTYKFEIRGVDGKVRDTFQVDNAVMTVGFAQIALLIGDATAIPFTYLAVGTSTTAVAISQTTLVAEIVDSGLARVAGTVSRITTTGTNDTYKITTTWIASGSKTIEEVGVFNASSAGTMLSRALTTSKAVVSGETITGTYTLKAA
jgi:hypothetical protein